MIEWQKNPIEALDNVKGALRRRIMRKAINRGVKLLRSPLKATVPVARGRLKKAVAQKVYTSRRKTVVGLVGARKNLGPHLHLVDKGTAERETKTGHRTGHVTGQDFMEPIFAAHKNQAIDTMRKVVADELHNEMIKASRG